MRVWTIVFGLAALAGAGAPSMAASKEVHVHVNGMVCAFCSQGLTKKLKANPSVENVKVDMEKKDVAIGLRDGASLSDADITKIVKDSGFDVEKITR